MLKIFLLLLILSFTPAPVYAFKDYQPEELPSLISDFMLTYEILNSNGTPHSGLTIDGIKIIRIKPENISNKVYTMTLYLDRNFITFKENIQLPYDFKWNFKGLSSGEHELVFVFTNKNGQKGVVRINLSVQH